MINVTRSDGQADCHLLEMPDGARVLIDAADGWDAPGLALAQLQKLGVTHLSLVVISHFHRDHYGRLLDLLRAGITIDRVAVNVPDQRSADLEKPWGCDLNDVHAVLADLTARNIPYFTPKAGEQIYRSVASDGSEIILEVLCSYDGANGPVGLTDVNDTSIIMRLSHGRTRVLFTGDLNQRLGAYLATSKIDFRAELLKAPHHGTETMAPNEFFDRVGAIAMFVPSPKKLWESPRSMRLRNYCLDRQIPVYVSGIKGNVTVTLTAKGYTIETER